MSPRERFIRAFHLEEPDRIPVTFSYVDPFVELSEEKKKLGYDGFHRLVRETDIILPRAPLGGGRFYSATTDAAMTSTSTKTGRYTYTERVLHTPLGPLHSRVRTEEGIATTWTIEGWVKTPEDVEKILSIPYEPLELSAEPIIQGQAQLGDRGIVATGVADPICAAAELFSLRDYAITASTSKEVIKKLLDFFAPRIEDYTRQLAEQTEDVLYRIVGPEYVTGPIVQPSLFREFVVPYDRRLVKIVKKNDNIACIHCHGRIREVVDDIRSIDPHVLEPIEPPPKGNIRLSDLKERIGDRICLMGYIQYNDLEFDSRRSIREKVRDAVSQGAPGGGYILFPTAEPIARITGRLLENQREMVRSGRFYGRYH